MLAKNIGAFALALIIAVIGAEIFLRLLVPVEIFQATWFSRGVHTPNDKYGYVFTPDYEGMMRHADGVWYEPITLDGRGMRTAAGTDNPTNVLLLGGRSMMFCYGVADEDTVHHVVERETQSDVRVDAVAWPGFNLNQSFHLYRDLVEPEFPPDLVVICWYLPAAPVGWADAHTDLTEPQEPPDAAEIFHFMDDLVVSSDRLGFVGRAIGAPVFRSRVLYGTVRQAGLAESNIDLVTGAIRKRTSGRQDQRARAEEGTERFRTTLTGLRDYFLERDAEVLVVVIPNGARSAQWYDPMMWIVPEGIEVWNLHKELADSLDSREDFLANLHYAPSATELIGKRLAKRIDQMLGSR